MCLAVRINSMHSDTLVDICQGFFYDLFVWQSSSACVRVAGRQSDFHFFPDRLKQLRGKKFKDDDKLMNKFFDSEACDFYYSDIVGLRDHWQRVIAARD